MPCISSINVSNSPDLNNLFGYDDYNISVNNGNSTQIPDTESSWSDGGIILLILIGSCICCFSPFICDTFSKCCDNLDFCYRSYCSRDFFSRIYSRLCPYSCSCEKKEPQTTHIENLFEIVVTQPVDRSIFCVICYEEFGKGKHGKLQCGHKFHRDCIEKWLSVSAHKDCPVCRHPV